MLISQVINNPESTRQVTENRTSIHLHSKYKGYKDKEQVAGGMNQ